MKESEKQLSAALRELAASARQSPPPELGLLLKDTFRHHHRRRRGLLASRVALLALCIVGLTMTTLKLRMLSHKNGRPPLVQSAVAPTTPASMIAPKISQPVHTSAARVRRGEGSSRPHQRSNVAPTTSPFVALPSLDMVPAGDELRIVRMELPGEDLRLVGAPITEEIARRRVTADFVVGHDGTPYAVRLVQSRF